MPGMPHPTADLHLRGAAPIHVTWTGPGPAPLVVFLGHEPHICTPAVVLAVTEYEDALSALQWCADHGAELGGDPRRLVVAGEHPELVAALAREARDRGWPPIEQTVIATGGTMTLTESYFAINRRVAAPRELVFQAWTDPELVGRWYDGEPFDYREVEPPARIVFTTGGPDLEIVTLSADGDGTVITFEGSAPQDEADWSDRLDALIAVAQGSQSGGNAGGIRPG